MAKFEFKLQKTVQPPETIDADEYELDTKNGKLTFFDEDRNQIASYATFPGAYVKKL
ncbi:MAG: hypothetical protein WAJ97_16195 [Terriglobales bacterium]|jgi:hypothetical protein